MLPTFDAAVDSGGGTSRGLVMDLALRDTRDETTELGSGMSRALTTVAASLLRVETWDCALDAAGKIASRCSVRVFDFDAGELLCEEINVRA